MNDIEARRMTVQEHKQGFMVCQCGKFAYIFRPEVLRRLPKNYSGELCLECNMWMCSVEKLKDLENNIFRGKVPETRSEDNTRPAGIQSVKRAVKGKTPRKVFYPYDNTVWCECSDT